MEDKRLNLYHGYWADCEGLILAVAMAEDHLLVRVIRTETTPQGPRTVVFHAKHRFSDMEGAKNLAIDQAATILDHPLTAEPQWKEYEDLGLLIRRF